jgi:hypothetical protein
MLLSPPVLQPGDIFHPVYIEDYTFLCCIDESNILARLEQAACTFIAAKLRDLRESPSREQDGVAAFAAVSRQGSEMSAKGGDKFAGNVLRDERHVAEKDKYAPGNIGGSNSGLERGRKFATADTQGLDRW